MVTVLGERRNRRRLVSAVVVPWLLSCGCDALSPPRRDPSKAPAPESAADERQNAPVAGSSSRPEDGSAAAQPEVARPNRPDSSPSLRTTTEPEDRLPRATREESASGAAPPPALPVRLAAGVALPQSLPTGTAMGFSIDYQFVGDGPHPSYRYSWIIRADGAARPWEADVQLQARGTLQTFVPAWKPRHGPFEAVLVEVRPDGSRRPISAAAPLKASD